MGREGEQNRGTHAGLSFAPEQPASPSPADQEQSSDAPPWKVLVVDDDEGVHEITRLVLKDFLFEGRPLELIPGRSGRDAVALAQTHPDAALLLLDVVMESPTAGLEAVQTIREELDNHLIRIILRTGHADPVPGRGAALQYDINDYKEKADLSVQAMQASVAAGLRGYRDLRRIESLSLSNQELERRVRERTIELSRANSELSRRCEERRRVEDDLRKSEESLIRAQAVARLGSWEWRPERGDLYWTDELTHILGVHPADGESPLERLITAAAEADRSRVVEALGRALAEGAAFDLDYRIVAPTGEERVVRHVGEVVPDRSGVALRLVGVVHDITERSKAEEQLRIATRVFTSAMSEVENHLNVATQVFDSAIEGVIATDPHLVIQSVNPAFTRITGYSAEEALGKTPRLLRSDHHEETFYQEMVATLNQEGRWQGEVWSRRKNGEAFPEQRTMTAVRDPAGRTVGYVVVFHDLSDLKRSEEQLFFKTYHDALTGLPNRVLFRDRLEQAARRGRQTGGKLAAVIFGLDLFKKINDSLGYATGDRLLQEMARRLEECVGQDDAVCRLGGDEFGLILGMGTIRDVVLVVQRIFESLNRPFLLQGHELYVTASIGISLYPNDGQDSSSLMKSADMAMNRAKTAGRNNFQFYTPAMDEAAGRRLALESRLRRGLERGEFVLHYQPKVCLQKGGIYGLEALVRWNQPEIGMVSPLEFIPLCEETGLITPLGEWILREACRQMKAWLDAGLPLAGRVAVNLSARQFQQAALAVMVKTALEASGLPAERLELEITESMVMADVEQAIAKMKQLQSLGIHLSMDDFGAGYSSLTYLKRFPIDSVKIDRSFISDLETAEEDAAIVAAIVAMAGALGLNVVAEGVETPGQLSFLRSTGADQIQGYLFSRPLPAADFQRLLEEDRRLEMPG